MAEVLVECCLFLERQGSTKLKLHISVIYLLFFDSNFTRQFDKNLLLTFSFVDANFVHSRSIQRFSQPCEVGWTVINTKKNNCETAWVHDFYSFSGNTLSWLIIYAIKFPVSTW